MDTHGTLKRAKPVRVTLKDVATLAGVSEISVSRVMRDAPNISQRLREKVTDAADTLSYTPNRVAGALKSRNSNLVAVVLPSMSHEVFSPVLDGIESVLSGQGLNAVLGLSDYDADRELHVVRELLSWSPMGIILTGLHHRNPIAGMVEQLDIPVVQIMDIDGDPLGSAVGISHTAAVDGIFYANDDLALGGLFHTMAEGIDVPGELALLGFNGIEIGKATPTPLSSIETPRFEIGAKAAELLLQPHPSGQEIVDLKFRIFEGGTT